MPRTLPLLLLPLLMACPLALAQVRCDLPGGRVLYTDAPCPAGAAARPVARPPALTPAQIGAAMSDSAQLQWRGHLAGEQASARVAADAQAASQRRAAEQAAALRAAEVAAQARQAAALEQLAREAAQRRADRAGRQPGHWRTF